MAAPQTTTNPPSTTEYGGDEVSALVLDAGYSLTRAGFAGEDVPKSVVSSYYGTVPSGSTPKYLFGDNSIHSPHPGISIKNSISSDGTVEDWDTAQNLWEYAITSRLTNGKPANPILHNDKDQVEKQDTEMDGMEDQEKPLAENPLLMTEPGWNAGKNREKGIEIAVENWGCPAYWLARSGVLAAFSAGKPSALVIDVGASTISVTPIHDGLQLKKGVIRSPLAGNYVSRQIRNLFSSSSPQIPLTPHYLVASKTPVDAGQPPQATFRSFAAGTEPDASFRMLQEERVLTEFKETVVQVWPQGRLSGHDSTGRSHMETAKSTLARTFEFPDGYNQPFGPDRYRPAESLFDPKAFIPAPDSSDQAPQPGQTLPEMIKQSLSNVDVDIRPLLLGNVVVVGGSSLLHGFTERLNHELGVLYPGARVRIFAPGNVYERRFASWIGGSILASLGTFHQMWISKKEYDEHGPGIVEKRCK